nr:hypothetical protein ACMD2_05090 [Ipomoea batatas]
MRTAVAIPVGKYLSERNQHKKANEANHKLVASHPPNLKFLVTARIVPNCFHPCKLICFLVHPQQATAQVWIMVFSWRVNGADEIPSLLRSLVHVLTKMKASSAAETLKLGVIPVVRFSFIAITL